MSKGGRVVRTFIPVEEAFKQWREDPEYVAAYDALEDEFSVASARIKAVSPRPAYPGEGRARPAGVGCDAG